jgi:hypothetical protein
VDQHGPHHVSLDRVLRAAGAALIVSVTNLLHFYCRYITKPQEDRLTQEYIGQVSKILWADAFTTPILALIDIPGKLNHYVFAPRANNQMKMNQYFVGSAWFLCERYAALVKTVFVTLFFSSLLPQGYFIAAAGQFVTYWVSLMLPYSVASLALALKGICMIATAR